MNNSFSEHLIKNVYNHEFDNAYNKDYISKNVFSKNLISRLNLDCELKGHEGCVNCLEWNHSGTLLASGSDDYNVMIWDPFRRKLLKKIDTKHRGNIFSVKFLHETNDSLIASAAADGKIYVYDMNNDVNIKEISSHQTRVKRLATAQDNPFLFWSCGEDSLVLQHDIRCATNKMTNVLLNYAKNTIYNRATKSSLEVKCIAINQVRSEMIGVGCNDPFARVYDRRMISLRPINNTGQTSQEPAKNATKCLFEYNIQKNDLTNTPFQYYVPGHLPRKIQEYKKENKPLSVTYLTFSSNGSELLLNLGGEQLYLFDILTNLISSNRDIKQFNKIKYDSYRELFQSPNIESDSNVNNSSESTIQLKEDKNHKKNKYKLPVKAEELKSKANASFDQQNYVEAIEYYNKAINLVPNSPILYGNRAAALMKRNWYGDTYCAMLDCYKALSFDIMHLKSHFRLAKCLFDLKWYREADEVIKIFVKRFPDYAETQACENLVNDIKEAIDNNQSDSRALRNRKKTSNNTLTKFLKQNTNHTNGQESEELESEDDTSSNEEDNEETDSTNEDDVIDLDQIDLSNYLNDDDEKMNEDDNYNKTGDSDSDSIYKLKRSTRKKRCDTNNNLGYRSNLNNDSCKKILNKKKKLKALIKRYNEVKSESVDFKSRYCGHCNVFTDIKEAAFLGENFICAGSDDCSFFIWDKKTTNIVRILKGDESVVNCIQPHPSTSVLATSGIDPIVKIWTPKFPAETDDQFSSKTKPLSSFLSNEERVVSDMKAAVLRNQLQIQSNRLEIHNPIELLLLNLAQNQQDWDEEDSNSNDDQNIACRTS